MKLQAARLLAAATVLLAPMLASAAPVPTWDKKIAGTARFKVLKPFDDAAVLDKETGLVWDRTPSNSTFNWANAQRHCLGRTVGGRRGWRLPTMEELTTLQEPAGPPSLPAGHPFSVSPIFLHWSSTTDAVDPAKAHAASFGAGGTFQVDKTVGELVWCVRGGHGNDGGQ